MKVSSPDITRALVAELTALRERHVQFQTRVKAANEAARARDEEARKQNAILTERIVELERELKQAKESIEVCAALFLLHMYSLELIDHHRPCISSANCSQLSRSNSTRSKMRSKPSKRLDLNPPPSKGLHQRLPESTYWTPASKVSSTLSHWKCVASTNLSIV